VAHPRVRAGREGDPWDLRAKLEPAEVFHQVLEHRWYMSQARGQSVPIAEVVSSYIDDVLRHRRDEATVMGPPTETMAIPVITSAISTIDDDDGRGRRLARPGLTRRARQYPTVKRRRECCGFSISSSTATARSAPEM
jgi:hypothetical protein